MSIVKIRDKEFTPFISAEQIKIAVGEVARSIDQCYGEVDEPVVMLVTLSGAMIFAADLARELRTPMEWAFVKCSSYSDATQTSGCVKFEVEPTVSLAGRDVLVVEDIVESGNTWEALHKYLIQCKVRSARIVTMAIKREVYRKPLPIDFVALEIDNKFAIGYGLDYAQKGRNLNGIYVLTSC